MKIYLINFGKHNPTRNKFYHQTTERSHPGILSDDENINSDRTNT
ncbi:MAG: hypothetical protein QNJ63_15420 [Calothrix sp. MO_192.B10]|nr:hypothetical protein [Calothrix sp. MO_192.B10]